MSADRPRPLKTDDPRACRHCGMPLPEREPGKPGRPRVVHEGACHRAYRNRQILDTRAEAFRAAHRRDRSDGSGVLFEPDDLDGYQVDDGWDGRPIPPQVLEEWETLLRVRRLLGSDVIARWPMGNPTPEEAAADAAFRALPAEEQEARLQRRIEELSARWR